MLYTEPRLSFQMIQNLEKNQKHFEYVSEYITRFKNGNPPPYHVAFKNSYQDISAYMLFALVTREQMQTILENEGVDIILPTQYLTYCYIATIDIAKPFQKMGIGTEFVTYVKNFNFPIVLQSTNTSEMYWESHGLKHLDYGWMMKHSQ